jgi:uncharacterized integral membrane protein
MFFRAFVFLLLLFIVLYVGLSNPQRVDFYFTLLFERRVTQPAALLYFAMFAIGVLAGMALNAGGGKTRPSGDGEARKRK